MQKVLSIFSALLILAFFCGSFSSNSQTRFNVNVYAGYTLPVADLEGDFPDTLGSTGTFDFKKSSSLLTSGGFNVGATGKYAADSSGHARLTLSMNLNSLTGSHDYSTTGGTRTFTNKVTIFSISAGGEYSISPKKKINPFLGIDIAANFYAGKIEASGDTTIIYNRKSETRYGVIATGGVDINLNGSIGIVVGVKYGLTNLTGKKTEITTTNTPPPLDIEEEGSSSFNEIPLNDEQTTTNPSKSLNYVQFYAGLSIYFGKKLGK
jgi:outer membrane protein W